MGFFDALAWLGETLDKPGAAVRGALAGRPDQLLNLIPFSDTLGITNPKERTYGRDLLEQYGMLGQNREGLDWGDVAGFGVDVALDPLNFIGLGMASRGARAAKAVDAANDVIRGERAAVDAANKARPVMRPNNIEDIVATIEANTASHKMRGAGALPEELLPQAIKGYEVSHVDDLNRIPGIYSPPKEFGYESILQTDPRAMEYAGEGLGEIHQSKRVLDQDELRDIARRVNEELYELPINPEGVDRIEQVASSALKTLQSKGPLKVNLEGVPRDVKTLDEDLVSTLKQTILSRNDARVRGEFMQEAFPGLQTAPGEKLEEWIQFALDDYMANEGRRLTQQQSGKQIAVLNDVKTLTEEALGSVGPARTAGQSFYVVPEGRVLDLDETIELPLLEKAYALNMPKGGAPYSPSELKTLHDMANEGTYSYRDVIQGRHPGHGQYLSPDLGMQNLKEMGLGAIIDSKLPGAMVAPGASTYLPYVAPKIRSVPEMLPSTQAPAQLPYWSDFIDKPRRSRIPQWLLASQNTLAPAGRY